MIKYSNAFEPDNFCMSDDEKLDLVNAHWGYIKTLLSAYNAHMGFDSNMNLAWIEHDYKNAMLIGLNGESCPACMTYPASRFTAFNIASAWQHGKKHLDEILSNTDNK